MIIPNRYGHGQLTTKHVMSRNVRARLRRWAKTVLKRLARDAASDDGT